MEINSYEPIVIPTLNRHTHLKQCLDSLGQCVGAEKTEIFISVDYPPSDRYVEGFNKVKEMLMNYDFGKFKNSHITYQDTNLGAERNSFFAVNQAYEFGYDSHIFTEDDNVFSPNFLIYMNWGLEQFKEDQRVFAICGFSEGKGDYNGDNIVLSDSFSAYGSGQWKDKTYAVREWLTKDNLEQMLKDKQCRRYLFNEKYKKYWILIRALLEKENGWNRLFLKEDGDMALIDHIFLLYMEKKKQYCLYPTLSKVRNIGCDGSGLHVFEGAIYDQVEEDKSKQFEPTFRKPLQVYEDIVKEANSDIYRIVDVKKNKRHYLIMSFIYLYINKNLARNLEDFIQKFKHNMWRVRTKQVTVLQLVKGRICKR